MNRPMTDSEAKSYVEWNAKHQNIILRNLSGALEATHAYGERHISMNHSDVFAMQAHEHVLAAYIQLAEVESDKVRRGLIGNAVVSMKMEGVSDINAFRRILAEVVRAWQERPTQRYFVIASLNAHPANFKTRKNFTVCGCEIKIRDWQAVQKRFDIQEWLDVAAAHLGLADKGEVKSALVSVAMVCCVSGRAADEALNKASQALSRFRCLLNFIEVANTYKQQFGGGPHALAQFPAPHTCGIFAESGAFDTAGLEDEPADNYTTQNISPETLKGVDKWARFLKTPTGPHDVMGIILEALDQYGQALDTAAWKVSFLNFWRVLEILTFRGNDKFNNEIVLKRVDVLLDKQPLLCDLLRVAHDDRNEFVHRGIFPDNGMHDVEMLRQISTICLMKLCALYYTYKTWGELEIYYKHAAATSDVLNTEMKVIRHVQRIHARRTRQASESENTA